MLLAPLSRIVKESLIDTTLTPAMTTRCKPRGVLVVVEVLNAVTSVIDRNFPCGTCLNEPSVEPSHAVQDAMVL
jgi:hypothetical protein